LNGNLHSTEVKLIADWKQLDESRKGRDMVTTMPNFIKNVAQAWRAYTSRYYHNAYESTQNRTFSDELEKEYGYKIIRQYQVEGYFLDGYVKELKLAIELNGNLWHSEIFGQKDKYYHINPYESNVEYITPPNEYEHLKRVFLEKELPKIFVMTIPCSQYGVHAYKLWVQYLKECKESDEEFQRLLQTTPKEDSDI
jgi:very-short-patch-repair endonuclease